MKMVENEQQFKCVFSCIADEISLLLKGIQHWKENSEKKFFKEREKWERKERQQKNWQKKIKKYFLN